VLRAIQQTPSGTWHENIQARHHPQHKSDHNDVPRENPLMPKHLKQKCEQVEFVELTEEQKKNLPF